VLGNIKSTKRSHRLSDIYDGLKASTALKNVFKVTIYLCNPHDDMEHRRVSAPNPPYFTGVSIMGYKFKAVQREI